MIYNVHAGHNYKVPGASGYFSETKEARSVKNKVIELLRAGGHTVYDCTDEEGNTQSENLNNIVRKCNSHNVDLDISIHFNASNGEGNGTEVLLYGAGKHRETGRNICEAISALGFTNRGIKDGSGLYVVKNTNALAILIECCFCDNEHDANVYNCDRMAEAIVKGLTGSIPTPQPTPTGIQQHNVIVECTADTLNQRSAPTTNSEIIGKERKGYQNRIINKVNSNGTWWLQDIAGYWICADYCKDVIYTCTVDTLNRREQPSLQAKIVGSDSKGYAHRVKEYRNADGIKWACDLAGYWFSVEYCNKSLDMCKL